MTRPPKKKKNVVVILPDSLRFDFTELGGFHPSPCPNIDSLISRGLSAKNMFSMGCPTTMSLPSIFTSTFPLDCGGYTLGLLNREKKSLHAILKKNGYQTSITFNGAAASTMHYKKFFDRVFMDASIFDIVDMYFHYFALPAVRSLFGGDKNFDQILEEIKKIYASFLDVVEEYVLEQINFPEITSISSLIISDSAWDYPKILDMVRREKDEFSRKPISQTRKFFYTRFLNCFARKIFPGEIWGMDLFRHIYKVSDKVFEKHDAFFRKLAKSLSINEKEIFFSQRLKEVSSAEAVVNNQLRWIEKNSSEPFFAWIHFYDTHPPCNFFSFDSPDRENLVGNEWGQCLKYFEELKSRNYELTVPFLSYLFSIKYVDNQIKRIENFLESKGLLDDTLLVLLSDHGVSFPGKPVRPKAHVTESFFDEFYHIPFSICNKDIQPKRIDRLAMTVDIAPTILDMLEIEIPSWFKGKSLISNSNEGRDYVQMEHMGRKYCDFGRYPINICVRSEKMKIVYRAFPKSNFKQDEIRECYDLLADPMEQKNLCNSPDFSPQSCEQLLLLARQRASEIQSQ